MGTAKSANVWIRTLKLSTSPPVAVHRIKVTAYAMITTIMPVVDTMAATVAQRASVALFRPSTANSVNVMIRTQRRLHPSAVKLRIKAMAYAMMITIMQDASLTAATAVPRAWVVLLTKHTAKLASALIRTQRHLHPGALKLRIKVMAYATMIIIMQDASLTAATAVPRAWVVLLTKHTAKLASALIRTQRHLHPSALKLR